MRKVNIKGKESAYKGFFGVDLYTFQHEKHDGSMSNVMEREVFERGNSVAVLMHDPLRDCVVLIEQFRLPAHVAGMNGWQIEVVAGTVEEGRNPDEVVLAEIQEEAGVEPEEIWHLQDCLLSQGACSEVLHLYYAKVDSERIKGVHGIHDEDIKPFVVPTHEAIGMMMDGQIQNATAIMALQAVFIRVLRQARA